MDVDLPLECDDEYWNISDGSFRQPEGKPCKITGFVFWLKLTTIMAVTLRTIVCHVRLESTEFNSDAIFQYSIDKSKQVLGLAGPGYDVKMVSQLDGALYNWLDSVPDHCS